MGAKTNLASPNIKVNYFCMCSIENNNKIIYFSIIHIIIPMNLNLNILI